MKKLLHTFFLNNIIEPEVQIRPKSDDPVIQKFLEGDNGAFKEIYDQYAHAIYRVTTRYLGSTKHSEELIIELFSSLHCETSSFDTTNTEMFKNSLFQRAKILAQQKMPEALNHAIQLELASWNSLPGRNE